MNGFCKRHRRHETPIAIILVCSIEMLVLDARPAHSQSTPVTSCGQVLSAPGNYHLTGDLGPCSGNGVEITADNVRFTLAGFTISGVSTLENCDVDNAQHGIVASAPATGVRISGGTVSGFVDGIVLYSSQSRASAMTVTNNCVFGIAVSGTGNIVETNLVTESGVDGVGLGKATQVTVRANDIFSNARYGVVISDFSDENTVQYNILRQNGVDQLEGGGIFIANGNANVIRDNAANGNFDGISLSVNIKSSIIQNNTTNGNISVGIAVGAGSTLNQIRTNTARGNGVVDLSDGNVGCAANVWKKNIFATDVVAGVPDGGPGTGCIR